MDNRGKDMRGDGAECLIALIKPSQVEIGRSSEISNIVWEGKRAVQDYAKVLNTGMEDKRGKCLCEEGEVKLQKLLGSAERDKLHLVWIQWEPIGRLPRRT